MIRGCFPSMMATAELVVPKSIPMTAPFTFSSEPSAYPRARNGDLNADGWTRRRAGVARGKTFNEVSQKLDEHARAYLRFVIFLKRT